MTDERKRLLNSRFREAAKQQPDIRILRRLLLNLGGVQLVAPSKADPDLRLLVDAGFVMAGPVRRKLMNDGACHENVARLWKTEKRGIIAIGTGYALSDHGLWRRHSWGIRREGILETTVWREKYFGVLLYGVQADCFAE